MNDLEVLEQESTSMLDMARDFRVTCDEHYSEAGEFVMGCKGLIKQITDEHEPSISAAHEAHKRAIALRDTHLTPVKQALALVSQVALEYKREQDRLADEERKRVDAENRKAEEERRLKEAEELAAKGDMKAAEEVISAPLPTERPFKPASVVPKVAGLSTQKKWKGRIIAPSKVKLAFCLPDQSLINAKVQSFFAYVKDPTAEQVKALEEEIGGVEVYQEEVFAGRVK